MAPEHFTCPACGHHRLVSDDYCFNCTKEIDTMQDATRAVLKDRLRKTQLTVKLLLAALNEG